MESNKSICIIPARGGSKRIPRKNIRDFHGKPMISYSITTALESKLFDMVMVSTEDEEIAAISKAYGASVPFLRSAKNADDFTGTGDVMHEVLTKFEEEGKLFDSACCLYATAPLLDSKRLHESKALFDNSRFDVVFALGEYDSPIQRSYNRNEEGGVSMNFPEFEAYRSQDLKDAFFDAGQFYWFYPSILKNLENKNLFGSTKGAIVLDKYEIQDVDQIQDWIMAEIKYTFLKSKKNNNAFDR